MNDIKLRDTNKILKKNGFELRRVSGDHRHYYNAQNQRLTLVFHMNRDNACPFPIWNKMVKKYNIKY